MIYKVEEIIPLIFEAVLKKKKLLQLPSGKKVRLSRTLKTFHHWGVICAKCGLEGVVFQEVKCDKKIHLRLFGIKNGHEIMMTRDHIIPYSKGGSNNFINMQTMCYICNSLKQDEFKSDSIDDFEYSYKSIKDYVLNTYPKSPDRNMFSNNFNEIVQEHNLSSGLICGNTDEILQYLYDIKTEYGFYIPLEKLRRVPKKRRI